jgi:hypothetical protein
VILQSQLHVSLARRLEPALGSEDSGAGKPRPS